MIVVVVVVVVVGGGGVVVFVVRNCLRSLSMQKTTVVNKHFPRRF